MHKMLLNQARIDLILRPDGPVLIKGGDALTAADPSRPDMAFVRTHRNGHETIYFPGSSIKGAIRSHCERIARTLAFAGNYDAERMACDPLDDEKCCAKVHGTKTGAVAGDEHTEGDDPSAEDKYRDACFTCQLFGNTTLAGHITFNDAYPTGEVTLEERNSVAIDRVFGSVRHGPFQFETLVAGEFTTTIRVHNFTCAHLGLVLLALRDLRDQYLLIGFGKSRGLGRLDADFTEFTLSSRSAKAGEAVFPGVARDLTSVYIPQQTGSLRWVAADKDFVSIGGGVQDDFLGHTWVFSGAEAVESAFKPFRQAWVDCFRTAKEGTNG
ncbi:MAG TPA: CRISPR-associated protein [Armatimonadetes bacterium]|nr:CRISPR-associated protein [Armatimonadota bacterium]